MNQREGMGRVFVRAVGGYMFVVSVLLAIATLAADVAWYIPVGICLIALNALAILLTGRWFPFERRR